MTDQLLWGTSRPKFTYSKTTGSQTVNYSVVLNQPPLIPPATFEKNVILNQSILGKYFEHIIGYRPIFNLKWDYLDVSSTRKLYDIIKNNSTFYFYPHWNAYLSYLVKCNNGFSLEPFGKYNQPYKGNIILEAIELIDNIPNYSKGSVNFDSSNGEEKKCIYTETSSPLPSYLPFAVDFWIRINYLTALGSDINKIFEIKTLTSTRWTLDIKSNVTPIQLRFYDSVETVQYIIYEWENFELGKWYHIILMKYGSPSYKRALFIDGVKVGEAQGGTSSIPIYKIGFNVRKEGSYYFKVSLQKLRVWGGNNQNNTDIFDDISCIRVDNFSYYSYPSDPRLYLFWDFSAGTNEVATDWSGNGRKGVFTPPACFNYECINDILSILPQE